MAPFLNIQRKLNAIYFDSITISTHTHTQLHRILPFHNFIISRMLEIRCGNKSGNFCLFSVRRIFTWIWIKLTARKKVLSVRN